MATAMKVVTLQRLTEYNAKIQAKYATQESVPTKVSDLTNDSNFQSDTQVSSAITAAIPGIKTSEITNDAKFQTDTEVSSAIATAIAGADHLKRVIKNNVSEINLSAEDADQYIYLVPRSTSGTNDTYDEYMVIEGALEKVGDWEMDLSDYAKTEDFEEVTADEINALFPAEGSGE